MTSELRKGKWWSTLLLVLVSFSSTIKPVLGAGGDYGDVVPIPIFIIVLSITVLIILFSLVIRNPILGTVGFVILFILGGVIETGNLGFSDTTTVNDTGSSITTVTTNYAGWTGTNNHIIGYIIQLISIVLWVVLMLGGQDEE